MKPATAAMSVFIGLNASGKELKLKKENIWAFSSNDASQTFDEYLKLEPEEALNADVPLVFISFPSAKDPNWATHPGKKSLKIFYFYQRF
jgi:all-trans-retinol 13,14-reductase